MQLDNNFPVDQFPPVIRNAIYEAQQITKAPIALIGASVLGAMSLACQNYIDVIRPGNFHGPVSLFVLTIAESGERKSTVDNLLLKPLHEKEEQLEKNYNREYQAYCKENQIAVSVRKALENKLKSLIKRGKDIAEVKSEIMALQPPELPIRRKLTFNDATPAAIKAFLCGNWNAVGVMSDEAGTIFGGHALGDLPFINKMWDGSRFSIERKNEPDAIISDARMTLSLMVQPEAFRDYLERKGSMAKGVGFFARCLISHPTSTQGSRLITNPVSSKEHIPVFHSRLMTIVNESLECSAGERLCLKFSHEAEKRWIDYYNKTESDIGFKGNYKLGDFKDFASKAAENIARIAAIIHYFDGNTGDISESATQSAIAIFNWYSNVHMRLFAKVDTAETPEQDAMELLAWIEVKFRQRRSVPLDKNFIRRYGPNRLRTGGKIHMLLDWLESQSRIIIFKKDNKTFVQPNWASTPTYTGKTFSRF